MPLLDSLLSSDTPVIIFIVILATSIVASYFFIRWAFSVDKAIKNQQVQISLLFMIAEKMGVEQEEIEAVKNYYKRF